MLSIPGYSQLEIVGHGSTATVYRAHQDDFGRTVAIKVLHVDVSDRRARRRFERERVINGQLSNHPNVVTVLDAGLIDGRTPYLAMEYFEIGSLAQRLAHRGPFPVADALHVGIRISGALESAHAAGILHRDVKPQNILLSRFGEPALADFGIAAILELEQSMTAALTPVHAPPEALEGQEPSVRGDVYALASTVFTLLSGTPPFAGPPGEGVLAQLLRITTMDLPALTRSDVPESLVAALKQGTAKRPEDRTPSAGEFARQLQQVQRELGLSSTAIPVEEMHVPSVSLPTVIDDPTVDRATAVARDAAEIAPVEPATSPVQQAVPSGEQPVTPVEHAAAPVEQAVAPGEQRAATADGGAEQPATAAAADDDRWRPPPGATSAMPLSATSGAGTAARTASEGAGSAAASSDGPFDAAPGGAASATASPASPGASAPWSPFAPPGTTAPPPDRSPAAPSSAASVEQRSDGSPAHRPPGEQTSGSESGQPGASDRPAAGVPVAAASVELDLGDHTVAARHRPLERAVVNADEPRARRWVAVVGSTLVAALIGGGAAYMIRDRRQGTAEPTVTTRPPAETVVATTDAGPPTTAATADGATTVVRADELALVGPADLAVTASPEGTRVSWAVAPAAGGLDHLVWVHRSDGSTLWRSVSAGDPPQLFIPVDDLPIDEPVCVVVGAVTRQVVDGVVQTARSEPACVNGAEAAALDTADAVS